MRPHTTLLFYLMLGLCSGIFCTKLSAQEATIEFTLIDKQGNPVPNIVIFAKSSKPVSVPANYSKQHPAVMDQVNKQFSPHILVVSKDSWVSFPNSDSIKHHVYSFSATKPFELKLYNGSAVEPLQFDKQGEVVMGCNIHDWMLGYIYVVDTPFYGKTNKQGKLTLPLPQGDYRIGIWSPLLQGEDKTMKFDLAVSQINQQTIQLHSDLLPSLVEYEQNEEFEDY